MNAGIVAYAVVRVVALMGVFALFELVPSLEERIPFRRKHLA